MNGLNATVGLFENGRCQTILHEEKFNDEKNFLGFPSASLEYLASTNPFSSDDVFVFPTSMILPGVEPKSPSRQSVGQSSVPWQLYIKVRFLYKKLEYLISQPNLFALLKKPFYLYYARETRRQVIDFLQDQYRAKKENIGFLDHHTCHCLAPVYFFGLDRSNEKTLIFSLDGVGDNLCAKVAVFDPKDSSLREVSHTGYQSSLGLLYAEATRYLGMKAHEHEYKVMGLAAYVSDKKRYRRAYEALREIIWLDPETLQFRSKFPTHAVFEFFRDKLPNERFDNLSAALQALTEDLIVAWVKAAIKKTGVHRIAVTGGVFMNVKVNQKILFLDEVRKAYFQPSCGDESLVIGAAADQFFKNRTSLHSVNNMYLGLQYSNEEVRRFLKRGKYLKRYKVTFYKDIEQVTAKLVAQSKIVARFKGRGEWGARALGNRSILGNAADSDTSGQINEAIKMRDFWMPFAPSILSGRANRYIRDWSTIKRKAIESTRHMILSFDSTPLAQKHLKAAMHPKDKTIRPQVVFNNDNPDFHKLLKYYEKLTGMGGLLNTSFNLHGHPLVGTLEQAMFTFKNSKLQYLTLENYLITKGEGSPA